MTITLAMLRTYVTVAESGSLTLAAEQLGRTPSAVSMALKQLEGEIGAPLFQGERKGNLTPTGLFTLERARNLIIQCDEGIDAIKAFARNEIGFISLACVPSVAEQILPPVIKAFHAQWPKVEMEIRDADSRSVINAVHGGRVQFGIASPVKSLPGLQFSPLFEDHLGLVCATDDPLIAAQTKEAAPDAAALLRERPLLVNSITQSLEFPEHLGQPANSRITVHNVTSVLALVKAGTGITILPRLSVPGTDGNLTFVPLDDPRMRRKVGLLQRSDTALSPAATALISLISERLGIIEQGMKENFHKSTESWLALKGPSAGFD